MFEGLTPSDDFGETGEFDPVFEREVPSIRIGVGGPDGELELTPANTVVRLFEDAHEDYTRVVVYLDNGTSAPFKSSDKFLKQLIRSGFPVELPNKLDESDEEFMSILMHYWNEDAYDELGLV